MLTDVIRLLLFPALMAFAASSDLLTMTISNRLSLALAGGFFLLTLVTGMSLPAIGMHLAAARAGADDCLRLLFHGLDRRRRRQARGGDRALVRLRLSARLSGLRLAVRRRADAAADPVPRACRCRRCSPARLDSAPARQPAAACPMASRSPPRRSSSIRKTGWMPVSRHLNAAHASMARARQY